MITLFHCVGARSFRPLWMLEELGLPYDLKVLPFPPRVHARDYLTLNPLGTIPLFLDGEVRMTESAAICEYLALRHGGGELAVPSASASFGAYLNWLHFGEATLTFPQAIILRYSRFEPAERRNPQAVQDYTRWFLARLRAVDAAVAQQPFLCEQRFTAADVSVGFALLLAELIGLGPQLPPAVRRYWSMLQARPAVQRALAAEQRAASEQGVPTRPAAAQE